MIAEIRRVPVTKRKGAGLGYVERLEQLRPGESLLLPVWNSRKAWRAAARVWGKGNVATRREGGQYRVWRIK